MSLEGVGSNTGVQAGEGSARDEGNGGDGERGAAPRETVEAVTWPWKGLAMYTGQGQGWQVRGKGRIPGLWAATGRVVIVIKIRHRGGFRRKGHTTTLKTARINLQSSL